MDVLVITGVVGSIAAVGTLTWAALGNPNLRNYFKRHREGRLLRQQPATRKVLRITWRQIDSALTSFQDENHGFYDLIVGLHPDGVSMANGLAGTQGSRFGSIEKTYSRMSREPFFVFEESSEARSKRQSTSEYLGPRELEPGARVLVVDGVATFGNALVRAKETVLEALPGASIEFFVFAVDLTRLSSSHDELLESLHYAHDIDNHASWLAFPWEKTT